MRPATTLVLVILLVGLFAAATLQFVLLAR
jgi:hypothetical protein